MNIKKVLLTGSPINAGFSSKDKFMSELMPYGYEMGRKSKSGFDILVTNDLDSTTDKMEYAQKEKKKIYTYQFMKDMFDLVGDL